LKSIDALLASQLLLSTTCMVCAPLGTVGISISKLNAPPDEMGTSVAIIFSSKYIVAKRPVKFSPLTTAVEPTVPEDGLTVILVAWTGKGEIAILLNNTNSTIREGMIIFLVYINFLLDINYYSYYSMCNAFYFNNQKRYCKNLLTTRALDDSRIHSKNTLFLRNIIDLGSDFDTVFYLTREALD
jgi:hypothetical protein